MGMDGYGGQSIIIDFDLGRIIVINSIHQNYNWEKIAHSVIKNGKWKNFELIYYILYLETKIIGALLEQNDTDRLEW